MADLPPNVWGEQRLALLPPPRPAAAPDPVEVLPAARPKALTGGPGSLAAQFDRWAKTWAKLGDNYKAAARLRAAQGDLDHASDLFEFANLAGDAAKDWREAAAALRLHTAGPAKTGRARS